MEGHEQSRCKDHERARGRKERQPSAVEAEAAENAARQHRREADARDRQRQAGAEGDDEQHSEGDAMQRDRRQQDDQCGRTGQQSAGDADGDERPPTQPFVVVVVMMVLMAVRVRTAVPPASTQHARTDQDDEETRDEVEPGIELLRHDEAREQERDRAEREDADRMRRGDDQAKERCMARRSALSDEVRGHDRLAVPRREGVCHAPEESCAKRRGDHPEAELIAPDERCKARIGYAVGRPQAGSARHVRTWPQGLSLEQGSFGQS